MTSVKKKEKKIVCALKNTLKHIPFSLFLIVISSGTSLLAGPALLGLFTGGEYSRRILINIDSAFESIFISSILFSFLLLGIFISYTILLTNISKISKILGSMLAYLAFGGVWFALLLLIMGFVSADPEAGWGIIFGTFLLVPSLILTVGNYIYMYTKHKREFLQH